MFSQIIPPLRISRHLEPSLKRTKKRFWIALLALIGFTLCAEDPDKGIEPSESDDSVTVQPNGYFKFSTTHHLHDEVVSYGDLSTLIVELTEEKLNSFKEKNNSLSGAITNDSPESDLNQAASRTERTLKRRILVLLDGERVIGTADRNMKIEEHLGTSLDAIESLEGFLSAEVDSIQIASPGVLNFVTSPPTDQESDESPNINELEIDDLEDGNPKAKILQNQQS